MNKIILNVFKAWVSTSIGILVPVVTGLITDIAQGQINWNAVKASLIPAFLLIVTDLLKEIENEIKPPTTAA
jgi:hypothetical protein